MAFGRTLSRITILGGDRLGYVVVLLPDRVDVGVGQSWQPEHPGSVCLECHLSAHQPFGSRSDRDLDVEPRVGLESGAPTRGTRQLVDQRKDPSHAPRCGPLGCQARRDSSDGELFIRDVTQCAHRDCREPLAIGRLRRLERTAHERAAGPTATSLNEASLTQRGDRLPECHRGDAQLMGELSLGRQLLTICDQAEVDRLLKACRKLLGATERRERGDER